MLQTHFDSQWGHWRFLSPLVWWTHPAELVWDVHQCHRLHSLQDACCDWQHAVNSTEKHMRMPITVTSNERYSISNYQPHDCLLNSLFRHRLKKTSKLRVTGLWAGNSPVTGEFPAQRASNAKNVSIWCGHHAEHESQSSTKQSCIASVTCSYTRKSPWKLFYKRVSITAIIWRTRVYFFAENVIKGQ